MEWMRRRLESQLQPESAKSHLSAAILQLIWALQH